MTNCGRAGILTALTALVYANSFTAPFHFDSGALIIQDPRVHEITRENARAILTQNYWSTRFMSGLYRPVSTFSYLFNYRVSGEMPGGYHMVNLSLHLVAVLLAWGVALKISNEKILAFWTALVWVVHPLNTEAVTNLAGRPDLLAAIAVFGGFLVYISSDVAGGDRRIRRAPYGKGQVFRAALLFTISLLGVFSKESAAVLLPLCLLFDWWKHRTPWMSGRLAIALPVLLRSLVHFEMARPYVDNPIFFADFWTAKLTALSVTGKLIGIWLWPSTLSADYSFNQIALFGWAAREWILPVALVSLIVWAIWQQRTLAGFWALAAMGLMVSSSNLLFPIGSIMAERFIYLPGLALAGVVVALVSKHRHAPALLSMVVMALGIRTIVRNQDWAQPALGFWQHTAKAAPRSFKAGAQLAAEYAALDRLPEAAAEADRVMAIMAPLSPGHSTMEPYNQFYGYYIATGQTGKARAAAQRAADVLNSAKRTQ